MSANLPDPLSRKAIQQGRPRGVASTDGLLFILTATSEPDMLVSEVSGSSVTTV